jgi:hypothetical protein
MASEKAAIRDLLRRHPYLRDELGGMLEGGAIRPLKAGQQVDWIVCGSWPSAIDGSVRVLCDRCGTDGAISPSGQKAMLEHRIRKICCGVCVRALMAQETSKADGQIQVGGL